MSSTRNLLATHKTSEVSRRYMILDLIGIGISGSSSEYPMMHRPLLVCFSRSCAPNKSNGPLTTDNPPGP